MTDSGIYLHTHPRPIKRRTRWGRVFYYCFGYGTGLFLTAVDIPWPLMVLLAGAFLGLAWPVDENA